MKFILVTLIFCVTLFLYLHVYFHIKTSDDLEIFDIEQPSKEKLEEICDLRQPMRMELANDTLENACQRSNLTNTYQSFDVHIRNVKEPTSDVGDLYVPLRWKNAVDVMENDTKGQYIIATNAGFLDESGLSKTYRDADSFIRPYMLASSHYDYLSGSVGAHTPFAYDIHYRNYLFVASGVAKIKLAPPKSSKYLSPVKDYHNFEFRSPIDPWNVQEEYAGDFEKIKCLEVNVRRGQLLFVPAYWWYSIEFGENTVVSSFKYDSFMSMVSTTDHHVKRFLQSHNVKRTHLPLVEKDVEKDVEKEVDKDVYKDVKKDVVKNVDKDVERNEEQINEEQINEEQINEEITEQTNHLKDKTIEAE